MDGTTGRMSFRFCSGRDAPEMFEAMLQMITTVQWNGLKAVISDGERARLLSALMYPEIWKHRWFLCWCAREKKTTTETEESRRYVCALNNSFEKRPT